MFIELTELLQCPAGHPREHLVLVPFTMAGRDVLTGLVGCPVCGREYPIADGEVRFGIGPMPDPDPLPPAHALPALLGLASPGGYAVLAGSAGRAVPALAETVGGVHFVAVNPPDDVIPGPAVTRLRTPERIPLRDACARGVILGGELASPEWLDEAARVLLPGQRLVVTGNTGALPETTELLARAPGAWVAEKRRMRRGGG